MSIQFNDTTNNDGLVQMYERECGLPLGTVSGDTTRLKNFTADVNEAWDDFLNIALTTSGTWQYDDSNQTDYPIIRTNLVSGQRDYTFVTDGDGNIILDIYRVRIIPSATATQYIDVVPEDDPSGDYSIYGNENVPYSPYDNPASTGVPYRYDKLANGIRFNLIPNYSATNGLEIHINREPSYFTYSDTSKKPGCPGILQKYFYLKPAMKYARLNQRNSYETLSAEVLKMEGNDEQGVVGSIAQYFGKRAKDEKPVMTPKLSNYI